MPCQMSPPTTGLIAEVAVCVMGTASPSTFYMDIVKAIVKALRRIELGKIRTKAYRVWEWTQNQGP